MHPIGLLALQNYFMCYMKTSALVFTTTSSGFCYKRSCRERETIYFLLWRHEKVMDNSCPYWWTTYNHISSKYDKYYIYIAASCI